MNDVDMVSQDKALKPSIYTSRSLLRLLYVAVLLADFWTDAIAACWSTPPTSCKEAPKRMSAQS
jgi:hypothetical protein